MLPDSAETAAMCLDRTLRLRRLGVRASRAGGTGRARLVREHLPV